MKKIITLLAVIGMFGFQGCTGPEGPPGMPGQDGADGQDGLIAEVFELTMNFTSVNEYGETFPLNPKIYSGDNLLVYELVNTNGGIDTWALLPQIYYFTAGTAQYNYNFSFDQFSIFIDASFPFAQLPSSFTTNKTFRIVIIPGDDGINSGGPNSKLSVNKMDYSDYNAVIAKYKIDDSNVKKIN
ncbi:hypothetical protein DOS84_06795 [Flavobacterium aquariorum]|uniref:Collagen-like protein n=1 Tax=Flavobacterium aquariorum TaxID=2217670 RepID=A0A2W7TY82_9FLAO|nr:hypothetical protein [Flavobacterium aquariorum]PZX94326.1 hypothetical protein DOS84_06795 [Flavobacterium aquariorum]